MQRWLGWRAEEVSPPPGEVANQDTDQKDTNPSNNAAYYFGIGGTKHPSQALACETAKSTEGFEAEDPSCMETDREIQSAGALKRTTQYGSDQEKSQEPWEQGVESQKRLK